MPSPIQKNLFEDHQATRPQTPGQPALTLETAYTPLELCNRCAHGGTYEYDFNRRCCRARHTLELDKPRRADHYARLLEREGKDYVDQRIADVKALHLYRRGYPKSVGGHG